MQKLIALIPATGDSMEVNRDYGNRPTIALTPKAEPFFHLCSNFSKIAFTKSSLALGAGDAVMLIKFEAIENT